MLLLTCLWPGRPAGAAVNYQGVNGLITIPSAYVQRLGQGSVGSFAARGGHAFAGNVSLLKGVEVSCSFPSGRQGIYGAKVAVLPEKLLSPALAVGVEDVTDSFGYYLAMSKQLPWGLRLHAGYRGGKVMNSLFCGMEKQIKPRSDLRRLKKFAPVFTLVWEYDGEHFNYGVYARNARGIRFDLGWSGRRLIAGLQKEF